MNYRAYARTVIVDVDGTLVDSNYQHAIAWHRAFRRNGVLVPIWRLHRHVGMGGDQIVVAVSGSGCETRIGDAVRSSHDEIFADDYLGEVVALPGARAFLETLVDEGRTVVLASSAKEHEVDRYLDLLGARGTVASWTTSADVAATKPEPDLVLAALGARDPASALMIGDTIWDCIAAERAGLPTVAVLTGGFGGCELIAAGAAAVAPSVDDLRRDTDQMDERLPRNRHRSEVGHGREKSRSGPRRGRREDRGGRASDGASP